MGEHFLTRRIGGKKPDTRESSYRAGWDASKRSTTYDLDAAESRYERTHTDVDNMFSAGWSDYSADRPYGSALKR